MHCIFSFSIFFLRKKQGKEEYLGKEGGGKRGKKGEINEVECRRKKEWGK